MVELLSNSAKVFLFVFCVCHTQPASADYDDSLSGDWRGTREAIETDGINVAGTFKADLFNLEGGLKDNQSGMYHLELGGDFDLEKLWGAEGWSAYLSVLLDWGERLNEQSIGSLLGTSNLEVASPALRTDNAWIQKSSSNGQYSTLIGLYPIDSEFSGLDSAAMFSNPAYGPPAELSLTDTPSVFPTSAFGIRFSGLTSDEQFYWLLAVVDGVAGDPDNPSKTTIDLSKEDGAFGIAEWGYTPKLAADGSAKFAAGVWGYSSDRDDLFDVDSDGKPVQRARLGGYLIADQRIWTSDKTGMGIDAFTRLSATDGNSSAAKSTINLGFTITGSMPSRPDDVIGVSYTRLTVGEHFRDAARLEGVITTAYEDTWEIGYRATVRPWLVLQPLAQYFRHAGALATTHGATVLGLRVEINL